ncbi:MAG: phosphatase PAP2 family protein [Streptomycetaceae bacterium]|nr:phosphatase PAP2 family protein [Streptomycetaceae bacterium]
MCADPLIPTARRPTVAAVTALCWVIVAALGGLFAGDSRAGSVDRAVTSRLETLVGVRSAAARALVSPSNSPVVWTALLTLVAGALAMRQWRLAGVALAAPLAAVVCAELLKPVVGRRYDGMYLCYPSGHTAAAVSVLTVAALAAARLGPIRRRLAAAGWSAVTAAIAVGMAAMHYHYPTDVLGGVAVALGVTLPLAGLHTLQNDP